MSGIPQELRNQLEDGTYLGSCDWGYCNREQTGWAWSTADAAEEWLPICAECANSNFPTMNDEPYPVDKYVSFDEVVS